ncbi:helix-turn-helix domain-containing protein [Curtobacterium sp. RRHDQ10]|uniref:helix-turn-helix domain-containing protein n=1 Tax=Curtobacterium phyllosphaerae TaxID=3413379 RepID=UPI003BF14566
MNEQRVAGIEALKALGHPLRARLFNLLSVYGAATATDLGKRIGESSGSTSYHLRQLEKHGLVSEDTERGTARERYWQRIPGPVVLGSAEITATPAGQSAALMAYSALNGVEEQLVRDFINYRAADMPTEWSDAADDSTAYLNLTVEQAMHLAEDMHQVMERYRQEQTEGPGTARMFVKYRTIPVTLADEPVDTSTTPIDIASLHAMAGLDAPTDTDTRPDQEQQS